MYWERATDPVARRSAATEDRDLPRLRRAAAAGLTVRELEVLLLSQDMDTAEIVDHLNLSRHTVQNYIRNAREKLGAKSKLSAVLTAQRLGLV